MNDEDLDMDDDWEEEPIDTSCMICGMEVCTEHLVASVAITEGRITAGLLANHTSEIGDAIYECLKADSEIKSWPLRMMVMDFSRTFEKSERSWEDHLACYYNVFLNGLCEHLSEQSNTRGPYDVDELSGNWQYQEFWDQSPANTIASILRQLGGNHDS